MKIERLLYYLSERVYGIFSTLFFVDLLGMGILYCLDVEINVLFGNVFFLLFSHHNPGGGSVGNPERSSLGLWTGSGVTLSAINYMKRAYRKELENRQNTRDF